MSAANLVQSAVKLVPFELRGMIKRTPILAHFQRWLVARTLDGREFEHLVDAGPAKGVKFLVRLPEDKGIWTGAYESSFASRLAKSVRPGDVAFDVGSWHGFFAGVMSAQGAREVHVFEPLPENAERIRKLVALNPNRSIHLHACAVGESDGVMDLIVMPETSMAKLESSPFQSDQTTARRIPTTIRSLDSVVARQEAPAPRLMKIDVEGAEIMVLRGALDTLRSARPELFMEIHSSSLLSECSALLGELGYCLESLDDDMAAARARDVYQVRFAPPAGATA